jgi:hypothetical protein
MGVRINLQTSSCCGASLKTVNATSGRYYLKCSKCGQEPLATPRQTKGRHSSLIVPEFIVKDKK